MKGAVRGCFIVFLIVRDGEGRVEERRSVYV